MEKTLSNDKVFEAKYFTSANPDGCSCPGWYWRHRCRHVDELRAAEELISSIRTKWDTLEGQR